MKCMLSERRGRARLFLWEGKPREPAKPEIKGNLGGASQGQLSLSKALPSLLHLSSSLTCVFLYFFQLLVSVSIFSSPLFFLPFYLCFSSLFLPLSHSPCIEAHTKWFSTPNSHLWGLIPTAEQKACTLKALT